MSRLSVESGGRRAAGRFRVLHLTASISTVPVDLFGDPDGIWSYDELVEGAGFDPSLGVLSIGALTRPYSGFPEGAAVVALTSGSLCSIALVDCVSASSGAANSLEGHAAAADVAA